MTLYNTKEEIIKAIDKENTIWGEVEIDFRELFFSCDMEDKWDMLCDALVGRSWGLLVTDVYFELKGVKGDNVIILVYGCAEDLLEEFESSE